MAEQNDNQQNANLAQVNSELLASLKRCRLLLDECRSNLAANSNEPTSASEGYGEEAAAD